MRMVPVARVLTITALLTIGAWSAAAQTPPQPSSLALYFDSGSTVVTNQDESLLDQAARLYREGRPIVMVVAGSTDAAGSPEYNLRLSQRRADTVLRALVARGIPTERFQIVAKGETEPTVATEDGVAEPRNRRVEITWR